MRPHEGQQSPTKYHLRPEMPISIRIIISCLLLFLIWSNAEAYSRQQNKFLTGNHHNFLSHKSYNILPSHFFFRGGDSLVDDEEQMQEEEEEYDDVIDEEETEGEDDEDIALTAASISAAQKVVKSRLAQGILERKSKPVKRREKRNYSLLLKMPYILRALLNPFTVMSMTKSYFASLFNIDYMKEEDPSQNLRSALSAKARKGGNSSRPKPKRTFKPGQAKTLHDLPQLSA